MILLQQLTDSSTQPLNVYITTNWKILKEMERPDNMTCLLINLYTGQEAAVRMGHGTTDWFQMGKRVCQGCILLPCLFKLYAEYIMRNAGLDYSQAGIKIARRNMTNLDSILKSRDINLPTKVHYSQGYGFSISHVLM